MDDIIEWCLKNQLSVHETKLKWWLYVRVTLKQIVFELES